MLGGILSPAFLQAAGQAGKSNHNRIVLVSKSDDPTLTSISADGNVEVITTKNGAKTSQVYTGGMSGVSLAISCDANTNIIIKGDVTALAIESDDTDFISVVISDDVLSSLSTNTSYNMHKIIVKRASALMSVNCDENYDLALLDLKGAPNLQTLTMKYTYNEEMVADLSKCESLTSISANSSLIEHLDLTHCIALTTFSATGCYNIEELDFSNCPQIITIDMTAAQNLRSINLSGCALLETLKMSKAYELEQIDIKDCVSLLELNLSWAIGLKHIDLSKNVAMTKLSIDWSAQLEELDLSKNVNLTTLECGNLRRAEAIYCNATVSSVATAIAGLITANAALAGTVYVNSADTYYSTIETAANNAGWTIAPLPA